MQKVKHQKCQSITEPPKFRKKIGNITFEVSVHFSDKNKETMDDKIMRLLKNEVPRIVVSAGERGKYE